MERYRLCVSAGEGEEGGILLSLLYYFLSFFFLKCIFDLRLYSTNLLADAYIFLAEIYCFFVKCRIVSYPFKKFIGFIPAEEKAADKSSSESVAVETQSGQKGPATSAAGAGMQNPFDFSAMSGLLNVFLLLLLLLSYIRLLTCMLIGMYL